MISKASVTPEVKAEDVLRHLVASLGQAAQEGRIRKGGDPNVIIEESQQRAYQDRYGG